MEGIVLLTMTIYVWEYESSLQKADFYNPSPIKIQGSFFKEAENVH